LFKWLYRGQRRQRRAWAAITVRFTPWPLCTAIPATHTVNTPSLCIRLQPSQTSGRRVHLTDLCPGSGHFLLPQQKDRWHCACGRWRRKRQCGIASCLCEGSLDNARGAQCAILSQCAVLGVNTGTMHAHRVNLGGFPSSPFYPRGNTVVRQGYSPVLCVSIIGLVV